MDEIIIKVALDQSNEGWGFYVYDGDEAYIACDEADGGLCTSTVENALDMAVDQAKDLIRRRREQ